MSMSDFIVDMLICICNVQMVEKVLVVMFLLKVKVVIV